MASNEKAPRPPPRVWVVSFNGWDTYHVTDCPEAYEINPYMWSVSGPYILVPAPPRKRTRRS